MAGREYFKEREKEMDLNKATFIGNLVKDPEAKELKGGQKLTSLRIATNYSWRDAKSKERKDAVEYHNVVAWGKLGEIVQKYLGKGDKVYLEGRLQTRSWNGKNGEKKYMTEMVASDMIMLSGKKSKQETGDDLVREEVSVQEIPSEA